jgi:hypothetical protein
MKYAWVVALFFLVFSSSENASARSDGGRVEANRPQKREKLPNDTKTVNSGGSSGGGTASSKQQDCLEAYEGSVHVCGRYAGDKAMYSRCMAACNEDLADCMNAAK